jgi:hypothetical protein
MNRMKFLSSAAIASFILLLVDQAFSDGRYYRTGIKILREMAGIVGLHF